MTNMIMTNDRHALTVGWGAPVGAPVAAPLLCVRAAGGGQSRPKLGAESLALTAPFLLRPELGAYLER